MEQPQQTVLTIALRIAELKTIFYIPHLMLIRYSLFQMLFFFKAPTIHQLFFWNFLRLDKLAKYISISHMHYLVAVIFYVLSSYIVYCSFTLFCYKYLQNFREFIKIRPFKFSSELSTFTYNVNYSCNFPVKWFVTDNFTFRFYFLVLIGLLRQIFINFFFIVVHLLIYLNTNTVDP